MYMHIYINMHMPRFLGGLREPFLFILIILINQYTHASRSPSLLIHITSYIPTNKQVDVRGLWDVKSEGEPVAFKVLRDGRIMHLKVCMGVSVCDNREGNPIIAHAIFISFFAFLGHPSIPPLHQTNTYLPHRAAPRKSPLSCPSPLPRTGTPLPKTIY